MQGETSIAQTLAVSATIVAKMSSISFRLFGSPAKRWNLNCLSNLGGVSKSASQASHVQ